MEDGDEACPECETGCEWPKPRGGAASRPGRGPRSSRDASSPAFRTDEQHAVTEVSLLSKPELMVFVPGDQATQRARSFLPRQRKEVLPKMKLTVTEHCV